MMHSSKRPLVFKHTLWGTDCPGTGSRAVKGQGGWQSDSNGHFCPGVQVSNTFGFFPERDTTALLFTENNLPCSAGVEGGVRGKQLWKSKDGQDALHEFEEEVTLRKGTSPPPPHSGALDLQRVLPQPQSPSSSFIPAPQCPTSKLVRDSQSLN